MAPLLKNAVEREEKIIMDTIRKSKEKINSLTKTLGVDTGKLMK
ncbi:hypothetical protein [Candidatus Kuenenia stuttgartiensis]|nr:hypothetical protein [Candidatus Kuenenia stuttgartiensis]